MTPQMSTGTTESSWTSHVQWGPIVAGAFAGFAATIILATLGAAMGITAGASAVDASASGMEKTAAGIGIGAGIWMILSAVIVGIVGGMVLKKTARLDRAYLPMTFGAVTWAIGVFLALVVASSGMSGAAGVLAGGAAGAGAGGAAGAVAGNPSLMDRAGNASPDRSASSPTSKPRAELTVAERASVQEAAEKAAKAAAMLAWIVLGAQLLSLAATMLSARCQKVRETTLRMGTQPA